MKILIITYDFFPDDKPNSYRWFNIAKQWTYEGHDIYVLTTDKYKYLNFEIIDGIKIYRSTEYFIGKLKYKYGNSINNQKTSNQKKINKSFINFYKSIIRNVYNYTWVNLYWPDFSFLWKLSAFPVATKLIEDNEIKTIITVSWTFTSHIIGYKLKKKNNDLFWLADTIDPFSLNNHVNNNTLYKNLNYYYEKKIFTLADFNSVLTENIKNKYNSIFSNLEYKIGVNHNLFIPTGYDYSKDKYHKGPIKIVFLGTLSSLTRSPKNTLIFFNNFISKYPNIDLRIDFFGQFTDTIFEFKKFPQLLDKFVFINDPIPKSEVDLIIKNTDILLNIGNINEYQEPSKLIEYMFYSKKILNICTINNDTSATLLKTYPLAKSIFPNYLNNDLVLDDLYNFLSQSDSDIKILPNQFLKDYLLESVSNKYLNFLSSSNQFK